MIDPDIDPAQIVGDIHTRRTGPPYRVREHKVMHPHHFGFAWRTQFPTTILEVADQFFLLVSTEMMGCPALWKACTSALMCSNWALRSGWAVPSRVFRVGLQAVAQLFSASWRPVFDGCNWWPWSLSSSANLRTLLQVQRKGDSGSPRLNGSTNCSRLCNKVALFGHRPLAPTAGAADPQRRGAVWRGQLRKAMTYGLPEDTRRTGHRRDAAITQGLGFRGRIQSPQAFVEERFKLGKTLFDGICVHARQHTTSMHSTPNLMGLFHDGSLARSRSPKGLEG